MVTERSGPLGIKLQLGLNELVDRVLKRGGRWHGCGA